MGAVAIIARAGRLAALIGAFALAAQVAAASAVTITGTAQQGQVLTAGAISMPPGVGGYAYQWEDCTTSGCSAIPGATAQAYTVAASDAGMTIVVEVWQRNTIGPVGFSEVSPPTAVVGIPTNITPPQVSISGGYGVIPGTWTGQPTGYSYQWLDCTRGAPVSYSLNAPRPNFIDPGPLPISWIDPGCTPISGATGLSYTPTPSDIGFSLAVEEWATNVYGTAGPVSSAVTYPYPGPPATPTPPPPPPPPTTTTTTTSSTPPVSPPTNSALPSIAGATAVGSTLTAASGSWTGSAPISYGYQWLRCTPACRNVSGATQDTYSVADADLGGRVEVLVTAKNAAGSAQATSAASAPIVQLFSAASKSLFESSLSRAIKPAAKLTVQRLVRRGGYATKLASLPLGSLRVTWKVRDRGAVVTLASGTARVGESGGARLRLVLSHRGRALLRRDAQVRVRAQATLEPKGGMAIEVAARFTLRG